jgi:hypothetical protein
MPVGSYGPRRPATLALSFACLVLVTACGSSSTGTPASTAGTTASSATTSAPVAGVAAVPSSCSEIKSLVAPYAGGVAVTKSLGPPPHGVSCEFANAGATKIVIVNVGQGTAASFAVLRTTSAQGGRTVAPITGLGSSAFSISNAGRPGGVAVLSAQGVVFAVTANLPFAKDEALIKQLMARY